MTAIDSATGLELFRRHRRNRIGIAGIPAMGSVCLICGSIHVDADPSDGRRLVCRNCGFAFERYACPWCDGTVDSRDPGNAPCSVCHRHRCSCGACACGRDGPGLK
jgi:hypothetical protein